MGKCGVIANGYGVSFWRNVNVTELDSDEWLHNFEYAKHTEFYTTKG